MRAILAALLTMAALSVSAQAPHYVWGPVLTASVSETAGTNVGKVIIAGKTTKSFALQIESMADANGAYVLTVPLQRSVDGAAYDGTAEKIAISFNGVTKQTIVTNIPTHGCGYFKIPYLTNATASINVTNLVIKYGKHVSVPRTSTSNTGD